MVVGCVLIYASADKILHPQDFAAIVKNYRLLPEVLVNLTAIWLPWFELVLGVCLYTGFWRQGALLLATSLLAAFWLALLFNSFRGLDVNAGASAPPRPTRPRPRPCSGTLAATRCCWPCPWPPGRRSAGPGPRGTDAPRSRQS